MNLYAIYWTMKMPSFGKTKPFKFYMEGKNKTVVKREVKKQFTEQFDYAESNGYTIVLKIKAVRIEFEIQEEK